MLESVNNTTSSFINNTCEPTEKEWQIYHQIAWWMQAIASPLLSCVGLILNGVAIAILTTSKKADSLFFNRLLVCLAIFDIFYLLSGISEAIRTYAMEPNYFYDYAFINFLFPFRSMVMFCSMYSTIILAFVRHNAIKNPLSFTVRIRQESSASCLNVINYMFPVVLASVIFYLPKFFEFDITYSPESCLHYGASNNSSTNGQECPYKRYYISETLMRRNKKYILWYLNVLNHIVTIIIPFILLVYFNLSIYKEMKIFIRRRPSSRRKIKNKEATNSSNESKSNKSLQPDKNEQSVIILSLVLMFLSCHLLRVVLNIQESVYFEWKFAELEKGCAGVKFWAMILVPFSEFMLLANSSGNFFIYYLFQKDFRNEIRIKLKKKELCTRKQTRHFDGNSEVNTTLVRDSTTKCTRLTKLFSISRSRVVKNDDRTSKLENIEMIEINGEAVI